MKSCKGWGFRIGITILYGLIGICTAVPFIYIYRVNPWIILRKNFLIGLVIGYISETAFKLVYLNLRTNTFWAYIAVAFTSGAGTLIAAFISNLKDFWSIIILLTCVEAGSLLFTFFMCRYKIELNEKLLQAQEKYKKSYE